jgi:hypothetical protein
VSDDDDDDDDDNNNVSNIYYRTVLRFMHKVSKINV